MARTSVATGLALAALVALWPEPAAAQCAMCRRALQSPEGQQMVGAFRSGILLLLAAPFSVLGVVAMLVVRMQRRSSVAAQPPSAEHPA